MKGTFFQRPLEFKLEVQGESWHQGDTIRGTLTVKNHGPAISPENIRVDLAHGRLSKVRAKSPDAFDVLSSMPAPAETKIDSQGEFKFDWSFQTERDCPITENSVSPFLLYGAGDAPGQLQLAIQPYALIEDVLQVFVVGFRFVVGSKRSSKKGVEVKLAPPDGKGFASVEQLILTFGFEGDDLELSYAFAVKKVEASAAPANAKMDVKKDKKTFEQTLRALDYRTSSGRFNHDAVENAVREVLSQIESKPLF